MRIPDDRRYTDQHEWAMRVDGVVRVGITDYAQDALGDVVFVDLPEVGRTVAAGEMIAEVESTKSVAEIYAPIGGTVSAVNEPLLDRLELVNDDPYGDGWFVDIDADDPAALDALLDADAYSRLTE